MNWIKKYQTVLISTVCIVGIVSEESTAVIGALSCVLVYFIFKKIIGF